MKPLTTTGTSKYIMASSKAPSQVFPISKLLFIVVLCLRVSFIFARPQEEDLPGFGSASNETNSTSSSDLVTTGVISENSSNTNAEPPHPSSPSDFTLGGFSPSYPLLHNPSLAIELLCSNKEVDSILFNTTLNAFTSTLKLYIGKPYDPTYLDFITQCESPSIWEESKCVAITIQEKENTDQHFTVDGVLDIIETLGTLNGTVRECLLRVKHVEGKTIGTGCIRDAVRDGAEADCEPYPEVGLLGTFTLGGG